MLKQEFSDGLQISMKYKILLYFDNSLLFNIYLEHYTNLSTLNHNVRFASAPGRWHNAIRVYALNPKVLLLIIPDTPAEKFPVRAVVTVNPGIQ